MKKNRLTFKITGSLAALLLGLSSAAGAASAADTGNRSIVISEIKGTAYISHGGTKQIRAYKGMELRTGDRIVSGIGGITLSIPDEGDQITLGDNSELNVVLLNASNGHTATKLQLVRGEAYADVHDLRQSRDFFELSPSDRRLEVKGTHFYVGVDPLTGQSTVFVAAGTVNAAPQGNSASSEESSTLLYPGQQLAPISGSESGNPETAISDISQFISNASPEVIEALIRSKGEIDKENDDFINKMKKGLEQSGGPSDLSEQIKKLEELQKVQQNLNTLVSDIAKQALGSNKLSESELEKAIQEANRNSSDSTKPINLNPGSALNPSKDAFDEVSKRQQEAIRQKQQEAARQEEERDEQKKRQQEELSKKLQDQLDKLNEMKRKLDEANQKAQEDKDRKAGEDYGKQLTDEQKEQLKKDQDQRQQDQDRMETPKPASAQQPPASSGSGSSAGGTVSNPNPPLEPPVQPPVTPPVKPPVNPPVEPPVDSTEFVLNFQEDPTGDRLAGEDHSLNFKLRSEKQDPQTPVKIKVTYTPDKEMSFDGIAYYYGYKDYSSTGNFVNRSVTLDAGEGTPFTLQELSVNPISLRTIWMKPAKYTITVELIQAGETQKSLGTYTRSFNVISGYPAVTGTHGSHVEQLLEPPAVADPLKLRLQLSLQKLEEGGSAALGQHFKLYYHGQLVGDGETNGDGIAKLHGQANEVPDVSEEGFKLVWLGAESGEYNMTGQWSMVNGTGEDEEQENINSPFHYHYSITAPEFGS
ncbi:FecR family protein [Paenibacillus dokdonensis]|uniref:FecR family protein n=1 Tax=Paenibacillus dokdonensis TaxID=2567944 RepID=UPI0010A8B4ED|nr:FecR family protein [Paenibacillus dokdonensis]